MQNNQPESETSSSCNMSLRRQGAEEAHRQRRQAFEAPADQVPHRDGGRGPVQADAADEGSHTPQGHRAMSMAMTMVTIMAVMMDMSKARKGS